MRGCEDDYGAADVAGADLGEQPHGRGLVLPLAPARVAAEVGDDHVVGLPLRGLSQLAHGLLDAGHGDECARFPPGQARRAGQVFEGELVVLGMGVEPEDALVLEVAGEAQQRVGGGVDVAEVGVEAAEVLAAVGVVGEQLDAFVAAKMQPALFGHVVDDGVGHRRAVAALAEEREDF